MWLAFNNAWNPLVSKVESRRENVDLLIDAFAAAADGSAVWGLMYLWDDQEVASAIGQVVEANGLRLHLGAGSSKVPSPASIPADLASGDMYRLDPYGRASTARARNHNKVFLFERLDPKRVPTREWHGPRRVGPALYLTSSNLKTSDRRKQNFAVVVPLSTRQLAHMRDYAELVIASYEASAARAGALPPNDWDPLGRDPVRLYTFPQPKTEDDILVDVLANVEIPPGSPTPTDIYLTTPRIKDRSEVIDSLEELARKGANVEIVTRSHLHTYNGKPEVPLATEERIRSFAKVWFQRPPFGRASDWHVVTHSKFLLVRGCYNGVNDEQLVFAMNGNLTSAAIYTNWETMIRIRNPYVFQSFVRIFCYLATACSVPAE